MASLESIFGKGGFVPPLPPKTDPPEVQIAQAFEENDIPAPRDIRIDGKVHRFPTNKSIQQTGPPMISTIARYNLFGRLKGGTHD